MTYEATHLAVEVGFAELRAEYIALVQLIEVTWKADVDVRI